MFYSTGARPERVWRIGIARNAVFFFSFVASKARKGRSEKTGVAEDRLREMSTKFAARLRSRAIWKSKSLKKLGCREHVWKWICTKFAPRLHARAIRKSKLFKTGGDGTLLEVDICAKFAPRLHARAIRKSKALKTGGVWKHFWQLSSTKLHHACARDRFGSQNR